MPKPDVSVIIVSFNTRDHLRACLRSVFSGRGAGEIEVIVVDNASTDGSRDAIRKEFPAVRIIENKHNLGFSAANNIGLENASGRYALLLNSDTELRPDGIKLLREFMDTHSQAGAAGPRLVYDDGTTQPSADSAPNLLTEFLHLFGLKRLIPGETARRVAAPVLSKVSGKTVGTYFEMYSGSLEPREVDCVSGACVIARADTVAAVGGLDDNFFMYMEDMDWCVRIKETGAKVYYVPEVEVVHHVGMSGEPDAATAEKVLIERYKSRLYFFRKHRGRGAQFVERVMMVKSFAIRWPFSRHRKAYSQIIKAALSG
jgi:GT2 family glycosyltransferase